MNTLFLFLNAQPGVTPTLNGMRDISHKYHVQLRFFNVVFLSQMPENGKQSCFHRVHSILDVIHTIVLLDDWLMV